MKRNVVIVFVKYPEPGKVKTRLAKNIGNEKAAKIYRMLTEMTLETVHDTAYEIALWFSPSERKNDFISWLGNRYSLHPQKDADLGERMLNACETMFSNDAERVVIIGTDCPLLNKKIIHNAFSGLEKQQCVIGPAQDGGYYLVGLSRPIPELFRNIAWSTSNVLVQTKDILYKENISFKLLPEHLDIDTFDDLLQLQKTLKNHPDLSLYKKLYLTIGNTTITER